MGPIVLIITENTANIAWHSTTSDAIKGPIALDALTIIMRIYFLMMGRKNLARKKKVINQMQRIMEMRRTMKTAWIV